MEFRTGRGVRRSASRRQAHGGTLPEKPMGTITVYNSGGDVLIRAFREKYRFTDVMIGS